MFKLIMKELMCRTNDKELLVNKHIGLLLFEHVQIYRGINEDDIKATFEKTADIIAKR